MYTEEVSLRTAASKTIDFGNGRCKTIVSSQTLNVKAGHTNPRIDYDIGNYFEKCPNATIIILPWKE